MSGRDNRGAGGGGGGGGGGGHQPLSSAMGKLKEKLTRVGVSIPSGSDYNNYYYGRCKQSN